MFVLSAHAETRYAVNKYGREQLRKRHIFLNNLFSPDPKQQKLFAQEAIQQRQRLEEAFQETTKCYSDVYQGVEQLHEKTVTEILVKYGASGYQGEHQQILQCVKSVGAAESWETCNTDKHVKEAVNLATEIELRRKDAAASDQLQEAYDKVVKGAEDICAKAIRDREELDLVSQSSEDSNIEYETSDLPVQEAEPPEAAAADKQEHSGGDFSDSGLDTTESESEEQPATAKWSWQQQQ